MILIGRLANQGKSIMVILQSSKSRLRHRLLMEHFAEMYVETQPQRETKNHDTR